MRILSSEALWRGTTPAYHSPSADDPRKSVPAPKGQGRFCVVPPCIYTLPRGVPEIKKPLSTLGQGRDRGTTLHYTLMAIP